MNATKKFLRLSMIAFMWGTICLGAEQTSLLSVGPGQGTGAIKTNALLQAWTVEDSSKTANPSLNFRLRRAELKLSGSVVENTRWFVMADLAKAIKSNATDNRILQDLGVGFTVVPGLEVVAGQFKEPTAAEGLLSSGDLLFPERSLPGRIYGDRREPGLMVSYQGKGYKLSAMASNGQGPNADATKDSKDISVRTDVDVTKELKVGAFGLFGDFTYSYKGRWGVNSRYTFDRMTAGAEYMMGMDAGVRNLGFVADAGYLLTSEIQPVIRFEMYKPNTGKSMVSWAQSLGVNYLLSKNSAKLQAAVSYFNNMAGKNGSPDSTSGSYGSEVTLGFQAAI